MAETSKRRHASKWSLVIGLVILVVVAMSCRDDGGSASGSETHGGRALVLSAP